VGIAKDLKFVNQLKGALIFDDQLICGVVLQKNSPAARLLQVTGLILRGMWLLCFLVVHHRSHVDDTILTQNQSGFAETSAGDFLICGIPLIYKSI